MTDSDHQVNTSVPLEQKVFPPDSEADKQVKFIDHEKHLNGKVTAINKNDASCYEDAPVMPIAREDFDFFMTVFENYENDKAKRAASQKKYFENNRASYYERQKKWRDGHKVDLNKKRREKYARDKLSISHDEPQPPLTDQNLEEEVVAASQLPEAEVDSVVLPAHQSSSEGLSAWRTGSN
jgi:hypothetical protein